LQGEEVSFFALCDGRRALEFASAQDHKRVGEGESGPNTGGMGAYSPAPVMTAPLRERVMQEIVAPTLKGMAAMGAAYKGVLFAGLMITPEGPKLIEFNVRFGDPEMQAILPRLEEDLLPVLLACAKGDCAHRRACGKRLSRPAIEGHRNFGRRNCRGNALCFAHPRRDKKGERETYRPWRARAKRHWAWRGYFRGAGARLRGGR
jgi:phosphoribosylamine-glycine ligase